MHASKLGDHSAQRRYGWECKNVSLVESFRWIYSSAVGGNAYAQYMLALYYEQSIGVDKDESLCIYWLEKSVQNGEVDTAAIKLASEYATSKYCNFRKSLKYNRLALEKGAPEVKAYRIIEYVIHDV